MSQLLCLHSMRLCLDILLVMLPSIRGLVGSHRFFLCFSAPLKGAERFVYSFTQHCTLVHPRIHVRIIFSRLGLKTMLF